MKWKKTNRGWTTVELDEPPESKRDFREEIRWRTSERHSRRNSLVAGLMAALCFVLTAVLFLSDQTPFFNLLLMFANGFNACSSFHEVIKSYARTNGVAGVA